MSHPPFRHPKNAVKNVLARHHALAKALAEGQPLDLAAAQAKYTLEQAGRLQQDMVFRELIVFYKDSIEGL